MVEQNTAAAKNAVAFSVVHRHPVRIQFGHAIRAARVKRGFFNLWNGLHFAKHFRRAGLVKTNFRIDQANGFQQIQSTNASNLRSGVRLVKTHTHKTLRRQVVNFSGLNLLNQCNARAQVGQVMLDQMQIGMRLHTQVFHAPKIDRTGSTVGAINGVAFL